AQPDMAVYNWKDGARQKLSAQVVGDELERLRQTNNGELTAELALDAARPKSSPLHDGFEWDDTVAAEQHRLTQARSMIRSVVIVPDKSMGPAVPTEVRAFVVVE